MSLAIEAEPAEREAELNLYFHLLDFIGDVETTKRRKKEINEMLVAHYPGWAAADDGKDNKERKSK